jgi:hypothetical protein
LSTGQLIVTITFVGLLGALHLVLGTVRSPAGASTVAAPRPEARRAPLIALLVVAAVAALAFAGVAFVVSVLDDEETTAPATEPTTSAPVSAPAPPPPQPPPPPAPTQLEAPSGTLLVARVVAQRRGSLADARNTVGRAPRLVMREQGVYEVRVPGLTPELRRSAVLRVRPASGARGVMVSARKVGPSADFLVFTRDAQSRAFAAAGFELAVFLPKRALGGPTGEEGDGRPVLPRTK